MYRDALYTSMMVNILNIMYDNIINILYIHKY